MDNSVFFFYFRQFAPSPRIQYRRFWNWEHLAKVDWMEKKTPWERPFSRPHWPFWGPLVAILDYGCSHRRNNQIKRILAKVDRRSNTLGSHLSTDLTAILGPPGGHFGFCRWWGVPGSVLLQVVSARLVLTWNGRYRYWASGTIFSMLKIK